MPFKFAYLTHLNLYCTIDVKFETVQIVEIISAYASIVHREATTRTSIPDTHNFLALVFVQKKNKVFADEFLRK